MNIEGLGTFYIGRTYDLAKKKQLGQPVLYDANDLVTHAVCVGMTGSGKTGLCIGLLEEAALDGIPALVIDPKGDLVNLLLTFPELKPENFAPWINLNDAARKGLSAEDYAAQQAELWRAGWFVIFHDKFLPFAFKVLFYASFADGAFYDADAAPVCFVYDGVTGYGFCGFFFPGCACAVFG